MVKCVNCKHLRLNNDANSNDLYVCNYYDVTVNRKTARQDDNCDKYEDK